MNQFMIALLIVVFWVGGWLFAHFMIRTECDEFGMFFVGSKIYKCSKHGDQGE